LLVDLASDTVTDEELADSNLVKIVTEEATDEEANALGWKCLGYRLINRDTEDWTAPSNYNSANVFPKWKAKYQSPPDVLGDINIYLRTNYRCTRAVTSISSVELVFYDFLRAVVSCGCIGVQRIYDPAVDKPVRDASMDLMRSIPRDYKGGVRSLASVGFKGWKLSQLTPNKTRRAQLVNWIIYYRDKLHGKSVEELMAARKNEDTVDPEIATLPSERWYQKNRLDQT